MQQMLKCYYCGELFDRTKEDFVLVKGRRYAHKACYENRGQDQVDLDEFWNTVKEIFKSHENYDYRKIDNQLKKYLEQGYTVPGITIALRYWFVVKEQPISSANRGIGIVPYIYEEAQKYQTYLEQQRAKITSIDEMQSTKVQNIQKRERKVNVLDFD